MKVSVFLPDLQKNFSMPLLPHRYSSWSRYPNAPWFPEWLSDWFHFRRSGYRTCASDCELKIPNPQWLPFFLFSQFHFIRLWSLIIRLIARFIVIGLWRFCSLFRKTKLEYPSIVGRFQLEPFLILTFLKQRFPHLWQHRNYTIASVRFGRCKTEPPTIVVTETVNNIMVDENLIILKITIIPSKTNRFTNPTSRSKQKCKQWHPVAYKSARLKQTEQMLPVLPLSVHAFVASPNNGFSWYHP